MAIKFIDNTNMLPAPGWQGKRKEEIERYCTAINFHIYSSINYVVTPKEQNITPVPATESGYTIGKIKYLWLTSSKINKIKISRKNLINPNG